MGKTKEWDNARRRLKDRFYRAGITTCELRLEGCWYDNALSFCHRMKRRKIADIAELECVILACVPCHEKVEYTSPENLFQVVTEVIKKRCRQPE